MDQRLYCVITNYIKSDAGISIRIEHWLSQASGNSFLPFRGLTFSTPNTSPHSASTLKTSFPVCFEPENGEGGVFSSLSVFLKSTAALKISCHFILGHQLYYDVQVL